MPRIVIRPRSGPQFMLDTPQSFDDFLTAIQLDGYVVARRPNRIVRWEAIDEIYEVPEAKASAIVPFDTGWKPPVA